jgi:hypothetical protein
MDLRAEAERLLWRYVVEVVERFGLCPWARRARERGEVRVEVLVSDDPLGPSRRAIVEAAARIATDPVAIMGMVVLANAPLDPTGLRRRKDDVVAAKLEPAIAVADFHPDSPLDAKTAARLVPWLRRAPDPTLQIVRLSVLDDLRPPQLPGLAAQAEILAGRLHEAPVSVSDQVAAMNLDTIRADEAEVAAAVAAIHADRDRVYAEATASSR